MVPAVPIKEVWAKFPAVPIKEVWVESPAVPIKKVWVEFPAVPIKEVWVEFPAVPIKEVWVKVRWQVCTPPVFIWVSRNTAAPMSDRFPAISVMEARGVADVVDVVDGVSTLTRGVGDAVTEDDPFGLRPPPCRAP